MFLYSDLKEMNKWRVLKRAKWPWVKLKITGLLAALLFGLLAFPLLVLDIIFLFMEKIGEISREAIGTVSEFLQEHVPIYKHLWKHSDRMDRRARKFVKNFHSYKLRDQFPIKRYQGPKEKEAGNV